jgi:hypothetical protein
MYGILLCTLLKKRRPWQIFLPVGAFASKYLFVILAEDFILKKPRMKTQRRV